MMFSFHWLAQRHLLYLDAQGLSAYRWQAGQLCAEGAFLEGKQGNEAFAAYLAKHARSTFTLLVDVGEEVFQLERVPAVRGREREALLSRRFGQHCHGTPLRIALSLGHETSGRPDEKILFAALTQPQTFEPWLAMLRQYECRLSGLYSLSLLAERLAAACVGQRNGENRQFLMCVQTRVGLRQFFIENGRVQFSRLTPLTGNRADEFANACTLESARMREYLLGQRQIARAVSLTVLLLRQPGDTANFRDLCREGDGLHFTFVDIPELAGKLGIRNLPPGACCVPLFMQLLMRRQPRRQFAPNAERLFHRLHRLRLMLNGAGVALLLFGLMIAARQLSETGELRLKATQLREQAADNERSYADIRGTFPPLPLGSADLRALTGHFARLVEQSAAPQSLYWRIGDALRLVPQVELERIDWRASKDAVGTTQVGNAGGPVGGQVGGKVGELGISAELHGELPLALISDERTLQELIEKFIAGLRKDGRMQVRILKRPYESESGKSLFSGSDVTANSAAPKFSLQLILNPAAS